MKRVSKKVFGFFFYTILAVIFFFSRRFIAQDALAADEVVSDDDIITEGVKLVKQIFVFLKGIFTATDAWMQEHINLSFSTIGNLLLDFFVGFVKLLIGLFEKLISLINSN